MAKSKIKQLLPNRGIRRNVICFLTGLSFISFGTFLFLTVFTFSFLPKYYAPKIVELRCSTPQLHRPKSKPLRNYIFEFKNYICADGFHYSPVIMSDGKSLRKLNSTLLDTDLLKCTYTPFYRKTNGSGLETYEFSNRKYLIKAKHTIQREFVKTSCSQIGIQNPNLNWWISKIKHNFFSFIPSKRAGPTHSSSKYDNRSLNIIIMGISGTSRSQFHHYMSETLNYLLEDFNMIEFGYLHVQSKDAAKNLIYLLSGNRNACMESSNGFQSCRFIFEELKRKRNYRTSIAEDCVENSAAKFGQLPNSRITDYYWNTFYNAYKNYFNERICSFCVGKRISYELVFDYQKRFINKMVRENQQYFGYFWVNSLNNIQKYGKFLDGDYKKLFQHLRYSGLYNKAAILFLSDGAITGNTRKVDNSDRVPFFFLHLPTWYTKLHQSSTNLYRNQERMVTYQDIYKTIAYVTKVNKVFHSGLFDLVDSDRDCTDANIDDEVCTC